MRRFPFLRLTSAVGLTLLLAACGSSTEPPRDTGATATGSDSPTASTPAQSPSGPTATSSPGTGLEKVTVTGLLEEGVEAGCLVITDEASGQVYTVVGADLPQRIGERLTVTGTIDPDMMSYCQQGAIVLVDTVTAAP